MPVRSLPSRYLATSQPLFSSPTRFSTGTFTSVKNTSFRWWLPSMEMIGRTSMPGVFMSISRKEMPSWRLARLRVGAHQAEAPVGVVRGGGPDLLAVDDVVVALPLRRGPQAGEVGAGAGLGEALAPPVVEVGGARQEALLLRLGAELHQHRAEHGDVEGEQLRRRRREVLLQEDHPLDRGPARAAPFLRPGEGGPALGIQDALPGDGVLLARRVAEPHALADLARQVLADEGRGLPRGRRPPRG